MALKLPITVWKSCYKWLCRYFRSDSLVRNFQSNLIFFLLIYLHRTTIITYVLYQIYFFIVIFCYTSQAWNVLTIIFHWYITWIIFFSIANFPVIFEFFDGIANHDLVYSIGCVSRFQLALALVLLHFFRKHLVIGVWWNQKLFGFRCVLQILSKIFSEFQILIFWVFLLQVNQVYRLDFDYPPVSVSVVILFLAWDYKVVGNETKLPILSTFHITH